ncbi:hypothetical protein E4U35_002609 [Claviceps purpurea]|nr:hypothetical protein E4U35_002609 [Claviceps purpurea]KAG6259400.1 hypothetical protein E4U24_004948 [Claviceps purpurea]KAG6300703.1 hypothetical protein E4U45_003767 [Claviceps purpurea]
MAPEPVHPLRISKNTPTPSPTKKMTTSSIPRPLSEISPGEKRRNSSTWQTYSPKRAAQPSNDSSPFQSSPHDSSTSPRLFWQNRNSENVLRGCPSSSPSPNRRSSIERLQKASRVKNSNILALEQKQEYDPTRMPHIERPLSKIQGSGLTSSTNSSGFHSLDFDPFSSDNQSSLSMMSPTKVSPPLPADVAQKLPRTPRKEQASPTKSSLSPTKFNKSTFDPTDGTWSARSSLCEEDFSDSRFLLRHPKSVTFDAAPPQVNEYEMATPDLSSIATNSREGSYESVEDDEDDYDENDDLYDPASVDVDESFDESLEDTDKTPVVGPDDWRGESPMVHRGMPTDKYEGSPLPENGPTMATDGRTTPTHKRSDSSNSNGDHRPLPPLPGAEDARNRRGSTGSVHASPGLSLTAERMSGGSRRSLPPPPPASASKSDIQNIGSHSMTLEERLKLMMLSDDTDAKAAAGQQRERRLRRGNGRERGGTPHSEAESETAVTDVLEADETLGDISGLDFEMPPEISRDSIMRRVNGDCTVEDTSAWRFSSSDPSHQRDSSQPHPQESPVVGLDPDVPIPSTEDPEDDEEDYDDEGSVIITRNHHDDEEEGDDDDEDDDENDVLDYYEDDVTLGGDEDEAEVLDPESHDQQEEHLQHEQIDTAQNPVEDGLETKASPPVNHLKLDVSMSGLGMEGMEEEDEANDGTSSPPPPPPPAKDEVTKDVTGESSEPTERPVTPTHRLSKPEYDGSGWGEPDDEDGMEEPSTPDSVIHHPVPEEEEGRESPPAIPERVATVKAPGAKLKTRLSSIPSDVAAMREARRQVSQNVPSIPPIPDKHRNRMSKDVDTEEAAGHNDFVLRHPSFMNRSLTLDLDMGLSLDQDFERVIEAQKRGYLMRQNTKVIAASDMDGDHQYPRTKSAQSSPIKRNRPESCVVEPWNAVSRSRSSRRRPTTTDSAIPPVPGHESNAVPAVSRAAEEDAQSEVATSAADSAERGRLFVKVMGVKDLDLPLPKNERTWFSLTLDNGVHCVTTAWLELARNAPIGQEFELLVPQDVEFQLTLNVKLEKPAAVAAQPVQKPTKTKTSTFSRVFASPKKRREMEQRQKDEERQQSEALARQRSRAPSAYELLSHLTADDGSFGRSYVCLKEHEHRCFGRPYMAEIACFNEWAWEEASFASSVKSKRGTAAAGVVRRAPYKIGKLEVQLLFVPRPKYSTDDDMPKSMNSCIREMQAAEERLSRNFEGHLSQQGGDCPYWRRRYFKLVGAKLTAYHEVTRQPRATINLANAKRLIDDRRALTEKETTGRGGRRRRSAFAEDEEGYMFVEEGFRIRFNNGEMIDFYADTAEDKEAWMKILSDVVGRGSSVDESNGVRCRAKWCDVVFKREEQMRRKMEGRRVHSRTKSSFT